MFPSVRSSTCSLPCLAFGCHPTSYWATWTAQQLAQPTLVPRQNLPAHSLVMQACHPAFRSVSQSLLPPEDLGRTGHRRQLFQRRLHHHVARENGPRQHQKGQPACFLVDQSHCRYRPCSFSRCASSLLPRHPAAMTANGPSASQIAAPDWHRSWWRLAMGSRSKRRPHHCLWAS